MLTRQQMERLDALAAGTGRSFPRTTAFAAFVAVLAVLLNRVGGARRLCIGIPVHDRRTRAGRDTLGLLMQVVPLTVRVDEDDTFLSLLERVELDALESWRYAQHTIPTSARQPLYDAVLNFHSPLDAALGGAPIQAVLLHSGHQLESLSIHVHDMPQAGVLTLDFDLHADVFRRSGGSWSSTSSSACWTPCSRIRDRPWPTSASSRPTRSVASWSA